MKPLVPVLACFTLFNLCAAQEPEAVERLRQALQGNVETFQFIEINDEGPTDFSLDLSEHSAELANEGRFGGFRFIAPKGSDALDMVWYFNIPQSWSNWYLSPATGPMKRSFNRWTTADKVYEKFDEPKAAERYRVLQELPAGFFEPGKEYLMWFRQKTDGGGKMARGRIVFQTPLQNDEEWDADNMEEALDLQPLPAEAQVAHLDSRGGKIMLDPEFFQRPDAVSRIDKVFSSLRRFQKLKGGLFITMEMNCPPCGTTPNYAEIRAKHGEADFIRDSAEVVAKRNHQIWPDAPDDQDNEPEVDEDNTITYYYDHFGFIVNRDDPDGEVIQVNTHAENYANLATSNPAGAYARLGTQNLTVFLQDGKEVGRIYYFLEESKIPLVVQEPPLGEYRNGDTRLQYHGDGEWTQSDFFEDGALFFRKPFAGHQIEGKAQWYFPDGNIRFSVDHQDGVYHGDFIEYNPDGQILKQRTFEHGKPVITN